MFRFRHQSARRSYKLKGIKSFDNVAKFKYLGTTVITENFDHEEIGGIY